MHHRQERADETRSFRAVRVDSLGGLVFPNLSLRLLPVLNCLATPTRSGRVHRPVGDLRRQIGRCLGFGFRFSLGLGFGFTPGSGFRCGPSFGVIQNPIGEQFHAVIHEEPGQSIAPHEQRPFPGEWFHENPKNRDQSRHDLRAEHRHP